MQNPIQTFRQSSIVFEKPGILSENLKTLVSSNYLTVQYFFLKLRTRFLLTNAYKTVCGIFLFCLDLELFKKKKKDLVSTHSVFTFLLTNNNTPLKTLLSRKRVQNVSKIILNFVTVGARQSFQFFIQIAWLLGYNRTLSKFRYTFLFMKNGFLTLAPKMV